MARLEDLLEDYATRPVPDSRTVGGLRVGMLYAAQAFSVPGLVTGVEIAGALGLSASLVAFLAGGLFLTAVGSVTGYIGARVRLSSYMLIKFAFGEMGSKIVNFAFALSQFGWFGVQVYLFAQAAQGLGAEVLGLEIERHVYVLAGGALMIVSTMFGFKLLNRLAVVIVPLMIAVMAIMLYLALGSQPLAAIFEVPGDLSVTPGQAISAVVGSLVLGAILIPDVTRYAHTWKGGVSASVITFFLASTFVYIAAAIPSLVTGEGDTLRVMIGMGLGIAAFALVILATWTTNSINLYGSSLSLSAVLSDVRGWKVTVGCGIAGTAAALFGILDYFVPFLIYLSVVFIPVGGIYITDFFLVSGRNYRLEDLAGRPAWAWPALTAWAAGSAVSYLTSQGHLVLSTIPAVDALAVAAAAYYLLIRLRATK